MLIHVIAANANGDHYNGDFSTYYNKMEFTMREVSIGELKQVSGGYQMNVGTAFAALAIGAISGGPVGLGIAAAGVVAAQGVNNLNEMYHNEFGNK